MTRQVVIPVRQAAEASATRHGEHIRGVEICRQIRARHAAGKRHRSGEVLRCYQPRNAFAMWPVTDDEQQCLGHLGKHCRHRTNQRVLTLSCHDPAHAYDQRPIGVNAETCPQLGATSTGIKPSNVDPWR